MPDDGSIAIEVASAVETKAVAATLARFVVPGDVILLVGELGAGKTTFAAGMLHALGVRGPVLSPTFALVREYPTVRPPVAHLDVYRLDHARELYGIGVEEYLDGDWVVLIEWGDRVADLLPADRLVVELVPIASSSAGEVIGDPAGRRRITWTPHGSWRARRAALAAAVETVGTGSIG